MKIKKFNISGTWRRLKRSSKFHEVLIFLAFVAAASVFWFVIALNDNVSRTFDVRLKIENVPDSVVFITDPPKDIHVTLRDKGTNLLRNAIMNHPQLTINFRDFAREGLFRYTGSDLNSGLRNTFGSAAQIASCSIDSLRLRYTTSRGKRVPIVVRVDASAAPGHIISGVPQPEERAVIVYSDANNLDTITRVYTETVLRRNLSETATVKVKLEPISGTRLIPASVTVVIPVEPLVRKEEMVTVTARNVPPGESLLLFPTKVPVTYYVPMSRFNDDDSHTLEILVDYSDTRIEDSSRLPLIIGAHPDYIVNPELQAVSVEYTLVKD